MIELHPEILTKDGKPEFVVLPFEEFMRLREELMACNGATIVPDPRYGGFWENLSAAELARRQGVKSVEKVEDLYGGGDPADWEGFEDAVEQWRSEHPLT
ncbi:MAG: hypothetical protein AB1813_12315 [Verrucomicrobiota bacterium]